MRLDTRICTCAVAALLAVSAQVKGDEVTFYFSGTLGSNARCPQSESDFCGPYTGLLTIDDNQDALEWIPGYAYYYRYAEAKIVFADGQTVTTRSPSALPPKQSAIVGVTPKLRVETSGDYLRITIDILDPEGTFSVIAPQYFYGLGTFDPANLPDVLGALGGKPSMAKLFVVGGACSLRPCVDNSLTPLRSTAAIRIEK